MPEVQLPRKVTLQSSVEMRSEDAFLRHGPSQRWSRVKYAGQVGDLIHGQRETMEGGLPLRLDAAPSITRPVRMEHCTCVGTRSTIARMTLNEYLSTVPSHCRWKAPTSANLKLTRVRQRSEIPTNEKIRVEPAFEEEKKGNNEESESSNYPLGLSRQCSPHIDRWASSINHAGRER